MNTKYILTVLTLFTASFTFAQSNVEVVIKKIKGTAGSLRVALFNSEEQFLKTPYKGEIVKISGETVTVVFKNVPAGTYGASVIHDENENEKMDTGMMGIPKEGFGFSNDAMGMFGPPKFKEASFVLPATKSVSVTLKYM
ncbi:MAG: hypothetical protein DI538_03795 [Azospira oryzae]|jgi:uncharacterized protein (DUF2141 family)|nr:MAG: hypothetical protein DI538_03795 [Azospira oryzae]